MVGTNTKMVFTKIAQNCGCTIYKYKTWISDFGYQCYDIELTNNVGDIFVFNDGYVRGDVSHKSCLLKAFLQLVLKNQKIELFTTHIDGYDSINLKENIFIKGFDTSEDCYLFMEHIGMTGQLITVFYMGKTNSISEEIAKQYLETNGSEGLFKDYKLFRGHLVNYFDTAIESIE